MERTIGNEGIWRFKIVLTTITIVVTIVSGPEFLLFGVWCLVAFGEAITYGNHEIFKLASKFAYLNIWRAGPRRGYMAPGSK